MNSQVDISTQQSQYFDFSFYEMSKNDIPAMVDYVLNVTKKQNITFLGHSQGATVFFSALAYNFGNISSKINLYVALAPVVQMNNIQDSFFLSLS